MRIFFVCALLAAAAGCFPDSQCDADQIVKRDVCIYVPTPSSSGADAAPGAEGDGGGEPVDTMGDDCTSIDHCGSDTDMCAVIPGQVTGFCTRSGCTADPSLCPAGWTCLDASAYVPGLSLCIGD